METTTLSVRVDAVHDEASEIRSFSVSRIDGLPFDRYEPGAHIDVTSPAGVTRQYSLCGDPARRTIGAPRNLFQLCPDASDHVLIAAGIGITPLLSIAYQLIRQHAPFVLHYFARSEQHAAFLPLLSRAPFAGRVQFHFGVERDRLDAVLRSCIADAREGTHLYTCGLGAVIAARFHAAGYRVAIGDVAHDAAQAIARDLSADG